MIQDIFPHQWDISYQPKKKQKNSKILFFYQDSLLVKHLCAEDATQITYPIYEEVNEFVIDEIYLFSLDGIEMFRVEIKTEEQKQKIQEAVSASSFENRGFFRNVCPKELKFAGITGLHLNGWYRKNQFCGACASPVVLDEKERMLRCPKCGNMIFPRINPAVIVGVTNKDQILLTKYQGRAYRNYALVAGFTEIGESFEETVAREVKEETGLTVKNIQYYKSQPWGFADDILAGYFCEVDGDPTITIDEGELSVAEWIKREDITITFDDTSLTNEMICYFKDAKI